MLLSAFNPRNNRPGTRINMLFPVRSSHLSLQLLCIHYYSSRLSPLRAAISSKYARQRKSRLPLLHPKYLLVNQFLSLPDTTLERPPSVSITKALPPALSFSCSLFSRWFCAYYSSFHYRLSTGCKVFGTCIPKTQDKAIFQSCTRRRESKR